jgi:nucleoside-diphosphate-sugar epimerase
VSVVLVTGATGFVGRYLCEHLTSRGHTVKGTLRPESNLKGPGRSVQWVKIESIGPHTDWTEALEGTDYVIHLAALAHQLGVAGEGRIQEFMTVNAEGTRRLAEAVASSATVKRLVFVSSVGAVASLSEQPLDERTPCNPDTDYGRSKLAAEMELERVLAGSHVDWTIVRPTLVYGPGNPGNMARLLRLVETGIPLPFGSIRNRRSFVYVGNLVDALERCMTHPGAAYRRFFVSDGPQLSTPELVGMLAAFAGKPSRLCRFPLPILRVMALAGDLVSSLLGRSVGVDSYSVARLIGSLAVDSGPIQRVLNWTPPFTVTEGLRATMSR